MYKLFKKISFLIVVSIIITTLSACTLNNEKENTNQSQGNSTNSSNSNIYSDIDINKVDFTKKDPTGIYSMPAIFNVRPLTDELYTGLVGTGQNFMLLVDGGKSTAKENDGNGIDDCAVNGNGCSATLTKLLFSKGISVSEIDNVQSGDKISIYYVDALDFINYGKNSKESKSWLATVVKALPDSIEEGVKDFLYGDNVFNSVCGFSNEDMDMKNKISSCRYAKHLVDGKGKNHLIGSAFLTIFREGVEIDTSIITDRMLDPKGTLNRLNSDDTLDPTEYDNFALSSRLNEMEQNGELTDIGTYRMKLLTKLRPIIYAKSNTANIPSNSRTYENKNIDINDLKAILSGTSDEYSKNFVLLIKTKGFLVEKIGTNYDIYGDKSEMVLADGGENSELSNYAKVIQLLTNSIATQLDNCAVASNGAANYFKTFIQIAAAGAAGAGLGALIGSVIPFAGTAIGAYIGLAVGIIAGTLLNFVLKNANGISSINYCDLSEDALISSALNVPVYTYEVKSFAGEKGNFYLSGDKVTAKSDSIWSKDEGAREYLSKNPSCLSQYNKIAVPSGFLSFWTDALDEQYNYADKCEYDYIKSLAGFETIAAPNIALYTNKLGKPVYSGELNGRITHSVIKEVSLLWGLRTTGLLYSDFAPLTFQKPGINVLSAQKVKNVRYVVSDSPVTPSLDSPDFITLVGDNEEFVSNYDNSGNALTYKTINDLIQYRLLDQSDVSLKLRSLDSSKAAATINTGSMKEYISSQNQFGEQVEKSIDISNKSIYYLSAKNDTSYPNIKDFKIALNKEGTFKALIKESFVGDVIERTYYYVEEDGNIWVASDFDETLLNSIRNELNSFYTELTVNDGKKYVDVTSNEKAYIIEYNNGFNFSNYYQYGYNEDGECVIINIDDNNRLSNTDTFEFNDSKLLFVHIYYDLCELDDESMTQDANSKNLLYTAIY